MVRPLRAGFQRHPSLYSVHHPSKARGNRAAPQTHQLQSQLCPPPERTTTTTKYFAESMANTACVHSNSSIARTKGHYVGQMVVASTLRVAATRMTMKESTSAFGHTQAAGNKNANSTQGKETAHFHSHVGFGASCTHTCCLKFGQKRPQSYYARTALRLGTGSCLGTRVDGAVPHVIGLVVTGMGLAHVQIDCTG